MPIAHLLWEFDFSTDSKFCFAGKAKCKAALQRELGVEVNPKVPLLGWIGRLDFQKGPDVVLQSIEPMAQRGCQVCYFTKHTFSSLSSCKGFYLVFCVSCNLVHCNLRKTFRIYAVVLQNVMLGCSVAEYEQHM